jgi:hypothetical protein
VAEAKEDREDGGCGPEAQNCTVAGLEGPFVEASEASGESVLEVAAGEVLLEQADQEEAEQPDSSVTEDVAAEEQAGIDDEKASLQECKDEKRETGDSPGKASEEVGEPALIAQAINGGRALFDPRHDPGNEEGCEEGDGLGNERERWSGVGGGCTRFGE